LKMTRERQLEKGASRDTTDSTAKLHEGTTPRRILTYHEVEPEKSTYIYAVTSRQLDEHLKLVAERNRRETDSTELTFDDGHISNYEIARPVLERHALKAVFFVTVGRVGTHPQTMNWEQLRTLTNAGHSVQSHGWSHKFLIHCSPTELRDELNRSKAELEQRTGVPAFSISLPGGRWNARVLRAAADAGYQRVYTSEFWREAEVRQGVLVTGRFMIRSDMSVAQIERWLSTDVQSLRMMRAKNLLQNAVRRVTGDRLYHELWCWLAVSGPSGSDKESEQVSLHRT
jgi:peptidoglycan/xylan/chitin deacetylase (PgdA/CDA1 family)